MKSAMASIAARRVGHEATLKTLAAASYQRPLA